MKVTTQEQETQKAMAKDAFRQIMDAQFKGMPLAGVAVSMSEGLFTAAMDPRVRAAAKKGGHDLLDGDIGGAAHAASSAGSAVAENFTPKKVGTSAVDSAVKASGTMAGMACFTSIATNPVIHGAIASTGPLALPLEVLFVGGAAIGCAKAAAKGTEMLGQLTSMPVKLSDRLVASVAK